MSVDRPTDEPRERSVSQGRHHVTIRPRDDQDEASIQADLDRSVAYAEMLAADQVESWYSHYRWVGPVKVMVAKEVGPPPWRWPRVQIRTRHDFFHLHIGWRMTAYYLNILWVGWHR